MKKRLFSLCLVFLLLLPLCALGEVSSYSASVSSISKEDGSAVLNLKIKELLAAGWSYGDLFSISLPDGTTVLAPFMEKLNDVSSGSFCLYAPKTNLRLGYRGEKITTLFSLKKGDVIKLTLIAPGYYRQIWVMNQLEAVARRKDSASDASYANFRMVTGGDILPNLLYRGTHPINGEDRAAYMQSLIEEAGIASVLNLSDTPESLSEFTAEGLYLKLLEAGKVFCAGMSDTDLASPVFQQQLSASLTYLAFTDSPSLIHCIYGKDRTGMVCAILQALCGASFEEIQTDYLLSYFNWYQLTPDDEAYGYAASIIRSWICEALNLTNPEGASLARPAREYLLSCGMSDSAIDALVLRLTGKLPEATPSPEEIETVSPASDEDASLLVFH